MRSHDFYRFHAKRVRHRAAQAACHVNQTYLLEIAETYDRLASQAMEDEARRLDRR